MLSRRIVEAVISSRPAFYFGWLLLAIAPIAVAAPTLAENYRNAIEHGVANGAYPALAVGIIEGGEQAQWFFGQDQRGAPVRADSGFEIGAINKVFTALLLSEATRNGKLRLDDPIAKFLPRAFKFADSHIGAITLEELATHRSGLPPLPANLFPKDSDDPYADYDETALLMWLAHYHRTTWTKQYEYSNLGYGLLGYLLGRAYGTDYANALNEHVLLPLGLEHTRFTDEADLLEAHNDGHSVAHWHLSALAAAGALRSTLTDMLNFAQLNLKPGDHPLRAALLLARQSRGAISNGEIGLAWHILNVPSTDQTWPLLWHNGATGGFSSFIGFRVDRQQAVVLLGNSLVDLTALGIALLTDQSAPPPPRKPLNLAADQLAEFTGLYQILPGTEMTLRVKRARLEAQLTGQAALPLYAADTDAFFYKAVDADLRFVRDEGKINGLVLHQNGQYFSAKRLSTRPPTLERQPLNISAKDLLAFNGDYQFDADTQARVVSRGDELQLQLTAQPGEALLAYAKDRFAVASDGSTIAFTRSETGTISGFSLVLGGVERSATRIDWKTN